MHVCCAYLCSSTTSTQQQSLATGKTTELDESDDASLARCVALSTPTRMSKCTCNL
jgi:hypothetical protein